jgi:hypothetical protein
MPDLTLYRDDVTAIVDLLGQLRNLIPAYPHSPQRQRALRLRDLLSDRLRQELHPPRPASCDTCGALRPLYPVNPSLAYGIETFACAQCLGLEPEDEELTPQEREWLAEHDETKGRL